MVIAIYSKELSMTFSIPDSCDSLLLLNFSAKPSEDFLADWRILREALNKFYWTDSKLGKWVKNGRSPVPVHVAPDYAKPIEPYFKKVKPIKLPSEMTDDEFAEFVPEGWNEEDWLNDDLVYLRILSSVVSSEIDKGSLTVFSKYLITLSSGVIIFSSLYEIQASGYTKNESMIFSTQKDPDSNNMQKISVYDPCSGYKTYWRNNPESID
jgi:hypothetical protein